MFYSQFGEDKILFEIFQRKTHGVCVEIGANNGVDDSTTLFFEKIGWKCILVEPNPFLCQEIRAVRNALVYEYAASSRSGVATLHVVEGNERSHGLSTISPTKEYLARVKNHNFFSHPVQVRTMTLDEILSNAQIVGGIDFISIDVEGHEPEVLEGFSLEKWKPTVILLENNSNVENNATSNYLNKFGYVRFFKTGVNDWYAHQTNKRLMSMRSNIRIGLTAFNEKIKRLKILLILKIRNFFGPRTI